MFFVRMKLPERLLTLGLLCLIMALSDVHAQPSGARGDDFIYRVMKNDTLIGVSDRFTGTSDNWPTLQSLNEVADPYALPIGLELRIPFSLIPEVEADAEITHITGEALVNQRTARLHDKVIEGDVLQTRAHSFITLQLPDGSVSALPPDTQVQIRRLRTFLGTGLIDTIMQLMQGELESSVAPNGQGAGRYEIQTPVSITGVRGTRLRVRTDDNGARTEVLSGAAQLGSTRADGPQLGALRGTAVTPDGKILAPRPLLPAPVLTPDTEQPHSRTIMFEPVPDAVAYHVRVAADATGTQPVWSGTIAGPPLHYRTPGSGTWYVLVRAIDDVGLMSDDATLEVEGRRVLISRSGAPVNTSYGEPITLTDY